MPKEIQVEAIDAYRYRIPRDARRGMRTDVMVYASEPLMNHIRTDLSLEQAMNVATLPGSRGAEPGHAGHSPRLWLSDRRRGGH